ncbi:MAG TPA: K(+)-transporting ATPase subunit C [Bryobacteraceae bacterium]|nr:K(+)-transporting ATPase subunit C [Bryobacteraceae bacterium]
MVKHLLPAFRMTLLLTVLTGLIYPAVVTGLCRMFFPYQAKGSLITQNGVAIGSTLIGQNFAAPQYFHPRPSAAGNNGYDAAASAASNLGPTNQKLFDRMKAAASKFRDENPTYNGPIPSDALTASGSGLDPDISVANAQAQVNRVALERRTSRALILALIRKNTAARGLGFLGEPGVNVLKLNLALDARYPRR